jgi:hypothetical protein
MLVRDMEFMCHTQTWASTIPAMGAGVGGLSLTKNLMMRRTKTMNVPNPHLPRGTTSQDIGRGADPRPDPEQWEFHCMDHGCPLRMECMRYTATEKLFFEYYELDDEGRNIDRFGDKCDAFIQE